MKASKDDRTGDFQPGSESAALEGRMRRYVDERLAGTVEGLLATRPGFYARHRVEIWGFLILFTLAAQWFWLVSQSVPRRPAAALPAVSPPSALAPAATGATPASARPVWAEWVKSSPLAKTGLEKLLAEEGVAKGSLSSLQRVKAGELLSDLKLAKTKTLDTGHLGRLLFEYVVKRSQGAAATGAIDAALNPSEYPPAALQALAAELGVVAAIDLESDTFRHELVMAWLERNVSR